MAPSSLVAHGVGGRSDLPLPFAAVVVAASVALVLTFAVLSWRWLTPRLDGGRAGRPLPAWLARAADAPVTRWSLRIVGLVGTGYVATAALLGPDDALNPTAGSVYVLFWVGVVAFGSALLGPLWSLLNPLSTLHLLLSLVFRRSSTTGLLGQYPARLGYWPAAASVLAFTWLELVAPNRATTGVLLVWFITYAVVHVAGGLAYGQVWFARADGFQVSSALYGRLSVLGRRDDGALVVRSPLAGLDQLRPRRGLTAVVCVALGSTAYDGLSQQLWWYDLQQSLAVPSPVSGTVALLLVITVVAASFAGAVRLGGRIASVPVPVGQFAPSLVPIALGYVVAHYWSLFVLVGQQTVLLLSDPLGTGADVLGVADRGVSYALVTPSATAIVQVVAVVVGHVVGVVLAHDRAVRRFPSARAVDAQVPLLAVMVLYTMAGLLLLFSG